MRKVYISVFHRYSKSLIESNIATISQIYLFKLGLFFSGPDPMEKEAQENIVKIIVSGLKIDNCRRKKSL